MKKRNQQRVNNRQGALERERKRNERKAKTDAKREARSQAMKIMKQKEEKEKDVLKGVQKTTSFKGKKGKKAKRISEGAKKLIQEQMEIA
mmetsp:Transcript_29818/g.76976  ORF Transcript_29818/g.76976 Transcript_29818/m.76976 type:complete len:90 (+) Transcript_29818:114-383(+)